MAHYNLDSINTTLYHLITYRELTPIAIRGYDKEKLLQIGDEITCNRKNYKIENITREDSKGSRDKDEDKIQTIFVAEVTPLQNIQ